MRVFLSLDSHERRPATRPELAECVQPIAARVCLAEVSAALAECEPGGNGFSGWWYAERLRRRAPEGTAPDVARRALVEALRDHLDAGAFDGPPDLLPEVPCSVARCPAIPDGAAYGINPRDCACGACPEMAR